MDAFKPLRIAVLGGKTIPGLDALIGDPNRGSLYELALVVGSDTYLSEAHLLDAAGIPHELRPIRRFHDERALPMRNLVARAEYDAELADVFVRLAVDYVILCGYGYVITRPLLGAFEGKILAIHDGDLSLRDGNGRRFYAGPHAVRDALLAGEAETRSSVYIVSDEIGRGPLYMLSAPYPIAALAHDAREWGDASLLIAYADLHRRWMVRSAWGTMLKRLFTILACGTAQVIHDVVWVDGVPGPCRMGESPRACHEVEAFVARGIPRSCPFIE